MIYVRIYFCFAIKKSDINSPLNNVFYVTLALLTTEWRTNSREDQCWRSLWLISCSQVDLTYSQDSTTVNQFQIYESDLLSIRIFTTFWKVNVCFIKIRSKHSSITYTIEFTTNFYETYIRTRFLSLRGLVLYLLIVFFLKKI